MSNPKKLITIIFIFLPLLFALFLMTRQINLPYVGPNATDPNTLSLAARNYNNWGVLATKFEIIKSLSKNIPAKPDIYLHHPILMVVMESFFFKLFGYGFWVGRVSVILPAFLTLAIIFLIGKEIKDKKLAIWSLIIASLIPATVIFGRMIHYAGAWTLFFILAVAYFILRYIKTNRKMFLLLSLICVILGTLSDWPVTYFTPFLLPLLFKNKKKFAGFLLIAASTLTATFFLVYSYFVLGSFKNIVDAILNRSFGNLLTLSFWPLRWFFVLSIRFILYFNPLILFFSAIYIYYFVKKLLKKKLDNFDFLLFAFFAMGITHIILYPEGSFGHPFWIYLLVPFVAFSAAKVISEKLLKPKALILLFILFSVIFALRIENWKTQQDVSQLYRYNLAKSISSYFIPYDTLDINPGSYIDTDLLQYSFYQNVRPVSLPTNLNKLKNANFYVYNCIGCNLNTPEVNFLAQNFEYKTFNSPPGTVYIFFLKQKQTQLIPLPVANKIQTTARVAAPKESFLRKAYGFLVDFLHVPQI